LRVDSMEMQKRAQRLARSVGEIEGGLRCTEERIEANARQRIRVLRKEVGEQLVLLRRHQGEAVRLLRRLASAPDASRGDLLQAARHALNESHGVVDALLARFAATCSAADGRPAPRALARRLTRTPAQTA
jgi:hypothetical protein